MFKEIAIISDIHGNIEALNTVFNDIKKRKITEIICLGDIIGKGSHSHECIELIKKNCNIVIKGNWDNYFGNLLTFETEDKIKNEKLKWNLRELTKEDIIYLSNLPFSYEFYMSGRLIRLFHAHPEEVDKAIGNIDKIERFYELFLPSDNINSNLSADVIIYGHIHTQYMQKIYNRIILNSGSVGNAIDAFRNLKKDGNVKNTTVANYLIIKGDYNSKDFTNFSFEFVSIPYDINKELATNYNNINFDSYKEELTNGKYRDMKKIFDYCSIRGIDKDKI